MSSRWGTVIKTGSTTRTSAFNHKLLSWAAAGALLLSGCAASIPQEPGQQTAEKTEQHTGDCVGLTAINCVRLMANDLLAVENFLRAWKGSYLRNAHFDVPFQSIYPYLDSVGEPMFSAMYYPYPKEDECPERQCDRYLRIRVNSVEEILIEDFTRLIGPLSLDRQWFREHDEDVRVNISEPDAHGRRLRTQVWIELGEIRTITIYRMLDDKSREKRTRSTLPP